MGGQKKFSAPPHFQNRGAAPGLVKSLAASLHAVVHSVPYQYQLDDFQQVKNVSLFFGRDYTINKQEKLQN